MSTGLKANDDGSAAIQVGGSDYLTVTSGGAATFVTSPTTMPSVTLHPSGSAATPSISFVGDTDTGIYRPYSNAVALTAAGSEVAVFNSFGNVAFDAGYGSVTDVYGCRAWVNFNSQAAVTSADVASSYSQFGTTVTVNTSPVGHSLKVGDIAYNDITSGTALDGSYVVATVTDGFEFTYTASTSLTTSGTCVLKRCRIDGSGNVATVSRINGTAAGVGGISPGIFGINFATPMPDVNYSMSGVIKYISDNTFTGNIYLSIARAANNPRVNYVIVVCAGTDGTRYDCEIVTAQFIR
jgi:hypothetical protein